ncbi:MFS transporter [Prolixibacter sp. NT017]|uniref:MFS transporter n=1 Tax=Prolixibacter sp. NT017 TaxID=2652390 RepID=UPI00128716CB|nr:MFS transporter [Prolixibacter sp. NT017]GET25954.1 MFS transporter [Prolixibacter sp. NT017]
MKRNYYMVALVFIVFFVISFITNILGSINPNVSDSFHLSGAMTGLLPFSFFIAYGLMSIPSGMLVEKYKEKISMSGGWIVATIGAFVFALFPSYPVFLGSLFFIGAAMALMQVVINPLLRVSGGEEHFAFYSVFAQLVFGGASFLSPYVYSYLVLNLDKSGPQSNWFLQILANITPEHLPWVSLYWVFGVITLLMIVIIVVSRFPKVERKEDETTGAWAIHKEMLKDKTVILFFFGIFAYVGTEQGIANWISEFLRTYHGLRPEVEGAAAVGWFWGMLTIGCLLGMLLLKFIDSKLVLRIFVIAAMVILTVTLFGGEQMAIYGFPALGFTLSVMWSITVSLALNSVAKYHGTFSGILMSGIAGGALVSLLIGGLKDLIGLRQGMFVLYLTLGYLLFISIWAKPLIANKTIQLKKQAAE